MCSHVSLLLLSDEIGSFNCHKMIGLSTFHCYIIESYYQERHRLICWTHEILTDSGYKKINPLKSLILDVKDMLKIFRFITMFDQKGNFSLQEPALLQINEHLLTKVSVHEMQIANCRYGTNL